MADRGRRAEILEVAGRLIATSGVRTSLQEIAEACGILPGSLYHHFDSKQSLVLALVDRYREDLSAVCAETVADGAHQHLSVEDSVVRLGTVIADCAVRHRAAVLLTFYEAPEGAGSDVAQMAGGTPPQALQAMAQMLRPGAARGEVRAGLDVDVLADRLCQSMLHVAIGGYHRYRGARSVPAVKCRLLLNGLVAAELDPAELDRSEAMRVARDAVRSWAPAENESGGHAAVVLSAARREFARRGYDATTVRDIAAAAGLNKGIVYRTVDSKEDLLRLITTDYSIGVAAGWKSVVACSASATEKIDALLWFNANVLARFEEEHRILSVWLRESPLKTATPSVPLASQLRDIKLMVSESLHDRTFTPLDVPLDVLARCVLSLSWTPENIVRDLGVRGAHELGRQTLLQGALAAPVALPH